ncbi:MAG: hypothetical protein AABW89_05895 [Nanoarchaeota archaeon]
MNPVLIPSENRCDFCSKVGSMYFFKDGLQEFGKVGFVCIVYKCQDCGNEQSFSYTGERISGKNKQTGKLVYL